MSNEETRYPVEKELSAEVFDELKKEIFESDMDEFTTLCVAVKEDKYKAISDEQILLMLDWYGENEHTLDDVRNYI